MDILTQPAMTGSKHLTAFGVIAIVLGVLAMLAPGVTGLSITMLLGLFVTSTGIGRMIWAFESGSLGNRLFTFALGTLTLACGLALLADPMIGASLLTIVLATYFAFDGVFEIAAGLRSPGGMWLVIGGTISILLGAMIAAQYPLSGLWAMGTLLGIKLFFVGLIMITSGSTVRAYAGV
jgi:uncharacterized membrane protein HdeD (DUF308 family)